MARVPPSPCFLLPGPDLRHRLFAPNMFRNVGRLHDVYQWYPPAEPIPECAEPLLTSSRIVTFDKSSHGQLAAVIYEWSDVQYLGKTTSYIDDLPVSVGARLTAANIDDSVLNIELAENIHLHNRCIHFPLLRRVPARHVHH